MNNASPQEIFRGLEEAKYLKMTWFCCGFVF